MNSTILSVKVDPKDKKKAQVLAHKLGFSLSTVIKAYLKEFLRTKRLDVRLEEDLELTDWAQEQLAQSEKDIAKGYVSPAFDNAEDAIAWLNDPKARYENGDPAR